MKTHLSSTYLPPEFDSKISSWLLSYQAADDDFPDAARRVGILFQRDGKSTVYRAIDGHSVEEIGKVYDFLHSIGLRDLEIYNHARFNCIYGLPEHRLRLGDEYTVSAFG